VALSQIFTLVPLWHPGIEAGVRTPGEAPNLPAPEFPYFSVQELMEKGTLLLASSGKEFTKPTGILASSSEVKKARKEAMGRLGLDFLETVGGTDDIDLDKELAAEEEEMPVDSDMVKADDISVKKENTVKTEEDVKPILQPEPLKLETPIAGPSQSPTPALSPAPSNGAPPPIEDTSNLSARERNRLKRKRKGGNSAFVVAAAPSGGAKYSAGAAAPPNK
jgi:TATA-binding protein-associated factor